MKIAQGETLGLGRGELHRPVGAAWYCGPVKHAAQASRREGMKIAQGETLGLGRGELHRPVGAV